MKNLKVIIADDHNLIRISLKEFLKSENIFVIGEVNNGIELEECYFKYSPDLVISDIEMPVQGGIETLDRIYCKDNNIKVLFISMFTSKLNTYKVYKAGGRGLIDKGISKDYLICAINEIINGGLFYQYYNSKSKLDTLVAEIESSSLRLAQTNQELNFREEQIIEFLSLGLSSNEIAEKLKLSRRTVDVYRRELISKLEFNSAAELISFATKYILTKKK